MEKAQARVQEAFTAVFKKLDKDIVRKRQYEMHKCSAKCCEDAESDAEVIERCLTRCSEPLQTAGKFIEQEVQSFQSRLERCAMDCQDRARDLMTKNNNDSAKVRTEMENCFLTCADTHIALLPTMDKRIRESLAKMK